MNMSANKGARGKKGRREGKIQRMLRRIKPNLSEHEYKVLYPSGSSPGKFYDTAKIHVPLETTIDIILRRIYTNHELTTSLTKEEMKELLLSCTKNVHLTFNVQTYIEVDGAAMASPLAPLLADIFMIELERSLIPDLQKNNILEMLCR